MPGLLVIFSPLFFIEWHMRRHHLDGRLLLKPAFWETFDLYDLEYWIRGTAVQHIIEWKVYVMKNLKC